MATPSRDKRQDSDEFQKSLSLILEAKKEDGLKRTLLERLLSQTAVCLNGLQGNVFSVINEDFADLLGTFEERIQRLQQRDYCILVAGETSSGKSCLINLLLGVDLLPYSALSTTSTICEIKYGEHPTLVAHYNNSSDNFQPPLFPKTVKLREPNDCGESYRSQIAHYVHLKKKRDEGSKYEKVEIFWPHELLKVGIVIIDSPGVGESEKMDQILMSYLPRAFAFIYVINCTNGGGIQRDRLVRILDKVRSLESKDEIQSNDLANCALFVANKWDQVDEDEHSIVKQHIVEQLNLFWPDGNPLRQTVYVSTKEALKEQKRGHVTEDYDVLLGGIQSMLLKAINSRLNNHWTWVNIVLDRILFRISGFNKSMLEDRTSLVERMDALHRQILVIQESRQIEIVELKKKFEDETESIVDALFGYLRSSEFERKFTTWKTGEIPTFEESWELTKAKIKKALEDRFEILLTKWEENNGVHAKVHDELVECFQTRFRLAEAEIKEIEDVILTQHSQASSRSTEKDKKTFNVRKKILIGATSPLWVTVGVASLIIALPALAIRKSIVGRMKSANFEKDREGYLAEKSKKFLASVTKEKVHKFVMEQMHLAEAMLQEYVSRIPRILNANRRMASELMHETRSKDEVWRSNLPVFNKCVELQKLLSKFGIQIWSETISSNQITWSDDPLIGEGEFASVYSGVLSGGDAENSEDSRPIANVAVKVFKQPLDCENADLFLKSETKLRRLQHRNVCKFFGATIQKDHTSPTKSRVALVMEICRENLRSVIFRDGFAHPVNAVDKSTILQFLEWVTQIADALSYIHDLKLIHKHLKLENILVGPDECIKLSDIGIIGQDEVTKNSMVYAAPEVLHSCKYSAASDVYSLGLVFWEMWYRSKVFSEILPLEKHEFMAKVFAGYRPQQHDCKIALPKVQTIINYCWAGNEEMRITASRCYANLVDVLKEFRETNSNIAIYKV